MLSHKDLMVQQLHYEETLRQVEKDRLIRQILAARQGGNRLHRRTLSWLGSRLVTWGHGLQERYDRTATAS